MPENRARRDRSDVGNAADLFPDVPHEGLPDRTARALRPGLLTLVPDSRAGVRSSSEWSGVVKNRRMTSAWAFFQPLLRGENLPSERARSRAADVMSNTVDSVIPMYAPHASAPVSGGSRRLTSGDSPLAVRHSQADRASIAHSPSRGSSSGRTYTAGRSNGISRISRRRSCRAGWGDAGGPGSRCRVRAPRGRHPTRVFRSPAVLLAGRWVTPDSVALRPGDPAHGVKCNDPDGARFIHRSVHGCSRNCDDRLTGFTAKRLHIAGDSNVLGGLRRRGTEPGVALLAAHVFRSSACNRSKGQISATCAAVRRGEVIASCTKRRGRRTIASQSGASRPIPLSWAGPTRMFGALTERLRYIV
jgi:hypothetical protein